MTPTAIPAAEASPAGAASPAAEPRPLRWLGGPSPFGLALPDASPSPTTMYAPRGVCLTPDALIAADTGNHRLLVWHGLPAEDHSPADVVIGQPDMTSERPGLLFLPTGLCVCEGRLVVADSWHHRVLVWDDIPDGPDRAPDTVLGQDDLDGVEEGCAPQRFYWPFGVAVVEGWFFVADTGNRRVLGWAGGIPDPGQAADVVVGQADLWSRGENRDGPPAADSLRWPHALTSVSGRLMVADAGNHRVLGWDLDTLTSIGSGGDGGTASVVIGQPDFATTAEFPYRPQGPRALRFPYAVASGADSTLYVADTSNNRVAVIYDASSTLNASPVGAAVDRILGQPDPDANGENRWDRVRHDSFCWPYGLSFNDGLLAVADSGNNRVVVWETGG